MSIWVDRTKHLFSKIKVLYQQIVELTHKCMTAHFPGLVQTLQ